VNVAEDIAQMIIDLGEIQALYLELLESEQAIELRTARNSLLARLTRAQAESLAAQYYPQGGYKRKTRVIAALKKLLESNQEKYDALFGDLQRRTDEIRRRYPDVTIVTVPINDGPTRASSASVMPNIFDGLPLN
jgi:hypothetical protein